MKSRHPVSTILPDAKRRSVQFGSHRRIVTAANFFFLNVLFGMMLWIRFRSSGAELQKIIAKMSENPHQHLNVSKWLEMVEHSSNRLGLLLSNDLGAAVRSLKNEAGQFSKAPVQDRVRELVLFGVSEEYFKLRKALGLAIG